MKRYYKSSIFIIDTKDRLSDSPRELEVGNFFQNPRDVLGTNFTHLIYYKRYFQTDTSLRLLKRDRSIFSSVFNTIVKHGFYDRGMLSFFMAPIISFRNANR